MAFAPLPTVPTAQPVVPPVAGVPPDAAMARVKTLAHELQTLLVTAGVREIHIRPDLITAEVVKVEKVTL